MPQVGTVYTIVIETGKQITDFVSFYNLPFKVLDHQTHKEMNSAYLYYYAYTKNSLEMLMRYALHFAANEADIKFDIFSCLGVMDNLSFIEQLKFGGGDGLINYYLYNY